MKPLKQVRSKRTSQIWRPSKIPADAGSQIGFPRISLKVCGPNYVSLRMKPTKQVRSKRTSQIWRPSKIPADAGSPIWFSRISLKTNTRPKLYKASHEALETSSFKTHLPNLTAFKNSSRRWITDRVSKDFAKSMRPKLCKPSHEAHQTSSFKTYLPNLTAFKKSSRRWITDLFFKDLVQKPICGPIIYTRTRLYT